MITRMSTLFLRTLREDPADAEVPSHRLLVRAGYVRRVGPSRKSLPRRSCSRKMFGPYSVHRLVAS